MTIQLTKITDDFSTAPQISVNDMAEIAHLGFKTIINNRPDNEGGAEQPTSAQLGVAAEKLGLKYVHIPIIPNNIQPNQIDAFSAAYNAERAIVQVVFLNLLRQTQASKAAHLPLRAYWLGLKANALSRAFGAGMRQNVR
jgi:uncharacterized protein (TIGR01244 family)